MSTIDILLYEYNHPDLIQVCHTTADTPFCRSKAARLRDAELSKVLADFCSDKWEPGVVCYAFDEGAYASISYGVFHKLTVTDHVLKSLVVSELRKTLDQNFTRRHNGRVWYWRRKDPLLIEMSIAAADVGL